MSDAVRDTSVASMAIRNDTRLPPYETYYESGAAILPFQVVAELRFGALSANWGSSRKALLEAFISRCAIQPYTPDMADRWAELMLHAKQRGRRLEAGDGWVAATALALGLPLLTHDADFTRLAFPGLTVVCFA